MSRALRLRARPARRRCPLCLDGLSAAPVAAGCRACGAVIHDACRALLGSRLCPTHGCAGTRAAGWTQPARAWTPRPTVSGPSPTAVGGVVGWLLGTFLEALLYALAGLLFGC